MKYIKGVKNILLNKYINKTKADHRYYLLLIHPVNTDLQYGIECRIINKTKIRGSMEFIF